MIKIAVVDDDNNDVAVIQRYFEQLAKEIRLNVSIDVWNSGKKLLENYDKSYDLICLDIEMPELSGIDTARKIRETDNEVTLIFITNLAYMAIEGYSVRALDFILKPVEYPSFKLKLTNIMRSIPERKNVDITISDYDRMIKISSDELLYGEVQGHYTYFHTEKATFRQRMTLNELEERLQKAPFKRCNNCYLVNLKKVRAVNKDEVLLENGEWLKISRPKKKDFLQTLTNYMGGINI